MGGEAAGGPGAGGPEVPASAADGPITGIPVPIDPSMAYARQVGMPALAVADDPVRRRELASLATDLGARLVSTDSVAGALRQLAKPAARIVLADLRGGRGDGADRLMAVLSGPALAGAGLVVVDAAGVDHAYARLGNAGVPIVVEPDVDSLRDAVATLITPPTAHVAEGGADGNSRRLAELSEEVGRIARALASLSEGSAATTGARTGEPAELFATARTIMRVRRARDRFFDRALFADPAWDMLLDLFAAGIERRRVAVSSLCIAAAVPPTTALRWIAAMTERGLFQREADPEDGRRVFIALTSQAATAMAGYLDAAGRTIAGAAESAR